MLLFFYNVLWPKFHPVVNLVLIMTMSGTQTHKNSCTAVEKDETDKPGAKDERRAFFWRLRICDSSLLLPPPPGLRKGAVEGRMAQFQEMMRQQLESSMHTELEKLLDTSAGPEKEVHRPTHSSSDPLPHPSPLLRNHLGVIKSFGCVTQ